MNNTELFFYISPFFIWDVSSHLFFYVVCMHKSLGTFLKVKAKA